MVTIGDRRVGDGQPVLVIAEAGVNHNGDLDLALELVDAAARTGADAVKFQAFKAERVASAAAPKAAYQLRTTDAAESQLAMLRRLELPSEANAVLRAHCEARGLLFLSSPFDLVSADELEAAGVPAFKIGSGELTNHPFLAAVARKGRPVLLSTGMATLDEVRAAAAVVREAGAPLVVLHCVSSYPAPAEQANVRAIPPMRAALDVPVGWSDHTPGDEAALAAVALGACVVEKHLTLDRAMEGPDHAASLDPGAFARFVERIRVVESALGDGVKAPARCELDTREVARRSLVLAADVPAGAPLEASALDALRPGGGISPARLGDLVGRRAARDLARGELLAWEDVA